MKAVAEIQKFLGFGRFRRKEEPRDRADEASAPASAGPATPAEIGAALQQSLNTRAFFLEYQPVFDRSRDIVQVEALLRTEHPLLVSVSPSQYVPIAEDTGLILAIGDEVLHMACKDMARWRSFGFNALPLAVNVSCTQLVRPGFAATVLAILEGYGIPPASLCLEITETVPMRETHLIAAQMQTLADAGVRFAIDDFGTGYSTLDRLSRLPISTMKIDRTFVQDLESGSRVHVIVQAMAELAGCLSLDLIAEGVERQRQIEILSELGCKKFQGYLFSRPVRADALLLLLMILKGRKTGALGSGEINPALKPFGISEVA